MKLEAKKFEKSTKLSSSRNKEMHSNLILRLTLLLLVTYQMVKYLVQNILMYYLDDLKNTSQYTLLSRH